MCSVGMCRYQYEYRITSQKYSYSVSGTRPDTLKQVLSNDLAAQSMQQIRSRSDLTLQLNKPPPPKS